MEKYGDENKIKSYEKSQRIIIEDVSLQYEREFDQDKEREFHSLEAEYGGYKIKFILFKKNNKIKTKIISITNLKSRILEPNVGNIEIPLGIEQKIKRAVKIYIQKFLNYKSAPEKVRLPYRDD